MEKLAGIVKGLPGKNFAGVLAEPQRAAVDAVRADGKQHRDLIAAMNDKLNNLIDNEVGEDRGQMLPGGIDAGWEVTPATMAP
jgi:hypothetical protein